MPWTTVPGYVFKLCKELRTNQTGAETVLWECLRAKRLGGHKFRRQHPLGRYIADFYCAKGKLVIELDGKVHQFWDQQEYDRIRDETMQNRDLAVLRFTNTQIAENLEQVLETILHHLPEFPPNKP